MAKLLSSSGGSSMRLGRMNRIFVPMPVIHMSGGPLMGGYGMMTGGYGMGGGQYGMNGGGNGMNGGGYGMNGGGNGMNGGGYGMGMGMGGYDNLGWWKVSAFWIKAILLRSNSGSFNKEVGGLNRIYESMPVIHMSRGPAMGGYEMMSGGNGMGGGGQY
ncbi:hypothetical protein JTE90_005280 [Oedothorax gibbosus]|uniref:Uncharacterized protein n=1 Tax=Oedothorax gibbosus TaxID=931172 RepID=A0AAV6U321_9ARAC|nr:hypothetical protein JTE90_005280 [Oedothorax gibbosus]